MVQLVRRFLTLEAAAFGLMALVHSGLLIQGHEHWKAATAESVIGFLLLGGLVGTFIAPHASRGFGLATQGFALVGTMVGIFTIAIGVGPRTMLDFVFHTSIVAVLLAGLVVIWRARVTPPHLPA
jgi:hypothetical protein